MPDITTIVRGDNTPQLQEIVYDYDPQRGWNITSHYEGASQGLMEQLAKQYAAQGIACRLTYRQDKASIEAHDATQQYTLDTWQIVGSDESRDNLSHPTVLSICTDDQIAAIRFFLNNINNAQPVSGQIAGFFSGTGSGATFPGPALSGGNQTIMAEFVGLQLRGITDYRKQQYVLRHSTNCPNRWPVGYEPSWPGNIALNNVECIYSLAKLLTEVTNPASWILPLPPEMAYTLQHLPASPIMPIPAGFAYGWLKSPSTTTTAANNRVDITTEYTLELWSSVEYTYIG